MGGCPIERAMHWKCLRTFYSPIVQDLLKTYNQFFEYIKNLYDKAKRNLE